MPTGLIFASFISETKSEDIALKRSLWIGTGEGEFTQRIFYFS